MKRRESLKLIALTTISSGLLLDACKTDDRKTTKEAVTEEPTLDRMAEEAAHDKKLKSDTYFTEHEMATIAVLSDIIIPRDEVSGSATDAKVPDFIEFIVKDMPQHQLPMRGGLRWLDLHSVKRNGKTFREATAEQQIAIVDEIAYPNRAKPDVQQGVSFFSLMRNLTATGFYTSEIGIKDVGYKGNQPNKWNGVPDDVLAQYGVAYTEKEMQECAKY